MDQEQRYQIIISRSANLRYKESILTYLINNFSIERAAEIDLNIFESIKTLSYFPSKGSIEYLIQNAKHEYRYILYRETKVFELKINYFIDELQSKVYITDFFPTKMNPSKINSPH